MTQTSDTAGTRDEGLAERETDLPPEPQPGARPSNVSSNGLIACPACEKPVTESFARFCASCGYRFRQSSLDEERAEFDPLVGRTVADRYRIESVLGRGGMGVVYKVEHTRIGKLMAMKLLHGDLARDREVVQRFRREAESVSKLDHANTVQVFDFGQAEGMTFLVMELLGGKDLGRHPARRRHHLLRQRRTHRFASLRLASASARQGHRASRSEAREHPHPR